VQVVLELPDAGSSISDALQQGSLNLSVQQLPQQAISSTGTQQQHHQLHYHHQQQQQQTSSGLPPLLQPVQYATLTAKSDYVAVFECDVVMLPDKSQVQAGQQGCSMLAAAAARAAGGPTASLAQQPEALLQALAPRLPAQHVSLMAAAAAPSLLQEQHRLRQQQQQQQQDAAGEDSMCADAAERDESPPAAAAALTLWRLQLCVTEAVLAGGCREDGQQQQQQHWQQQQVNLWAVMHWCVPHWCYRDTSRQSPWQAWQASRDFDAAQVYRVTKPTGCEVQLQGDPAGLLPQLRGYQRRAVAWMLGLEHEQHASAAAAAAAGAALPGSSRSSSMQQLLAGLLRPYSEWVSVLLLPPATQHGEAQPSSSSAVPAGVSSNQGAAAGTGSGLGEWGDLRQLFLHPVLGLMSRAAPEQEPVVPGGGCMGSRYTRCIMFATFMLGSCHLLHIMMLIGFRSFSVACELSTSAEGYQLLAFVPLGNMVVVPVTVSCDVCWLYVPCRYIGR
jgi:hypothetical protein